MLAYVRRHALADSIASTAVVTGASSGIGADIARELAARGHGVTLVARREDKLRELAAELGGRVRVEVIACDVADPDARAGLFDEVDRRGLTVDILVNNAGIGTMGSVAEAPVADEIAQVRVNVEAVIDLTTARRAADGAARPRRDPQRRLDRGLPPVPRPGRLRRHQGVRHAPTPKGCARELAGTGVTVATAASRAGAHRVPAEPRAWTSGRSPTRSRSSCGCRRARSPGPASTRSTDDRGNVIAGPAEPDQHPAVPAACRDGCCCRCWPSSIPALRRDRVSELNRASAASSPRPAAPARCTACRSSGTSRRR